MESVFSIIIIVAVTIMAMRRLNMRDKKAASPKSASVKTTSTKPASAKTTSTRPVYEGAVHDFDRPVKTSRISATTLKDDRNNDWLAKQMREERSALNAMSEMFGLKLSHMANCEARNIRKEHHDNCDAGSIDVAKGR